MSLIIGPYKMPNRLVLAPMAGITDRPFRQLCREPGAGLTSSEMLTAKPRLWDTAKSRRRLDYEGEPGPVVVQIAGAEPQMPVTAARCGIMALAVHGRSRACRLQGKAEYQTIRQIKQAVAIPVIANGDIDSPQKTVRVFEETKADDVMIGRAGSPVAVFAYRFLLPLREIETRSRKPPGP